MIMKVLLLYPDTNFIELIERFFLTYSTWKEMTEIVTGPNLAAQRF
uniref:Uncharacterized protein n=1 Tax=Meloidogyne enterolobii TaxID=390850 RepID=A0A6V7Y4V8_MELEN|nr:unnamed protein product [Meloidogyne enterolobii]